MKKEDADQLIRCVKECWWRVLVVIAAPLFLILALKNGLQIILTLKEGTAAWVQAIGSILAILAAVALYFAGEWHERKKKNKEDINYVTDVMRTVESIAYELVRTMDHLYDNHYLFGVVGDLPRDVVKTDRQPQQVLSEIHGVRVTFEEFCEKRAAVIEHCYMEMSLIDWSKPPISRIAIYLVSIKYDFHVFFNLLKSDVEVESKRKILRDNALHVSNKVIQAGDLLEEVYGYRSNWEYRKRQPSWIANKS